MNLRKKDKEIEEGPTFKNDWLYWVNEASEDERSDMKERIYKSRIGYIKSKYDI